MGVKSETSLQERIQKFIRSKGGYVNKNWGNMTSAPGIADLTACYKGYYLAIEVKDGDNTPSKAQGIHCREVQKAGGLTLIAWTIDEVKHLLDLVDDIAEGNIDKSNAILEYAHWGLDDGTRW